MGWHERTNILFPTIKTERQLSEPPSDTYSDVYASDKGFLRIYFYKHSRNFQHSHLDFQVPVLRPVQFVDIYMAFHCHTKTSCSVVMDASSRKHVTVFSFGNFNRFGVVAVNGGQWIESYLPISSWNTKVLIQFRDSILHSTLKTKAVNIREIK